MRAKPVDEALDERRTASPSRPGDRLLGDDVSGHRVAAVEGHAGEAVARCALRRVLDRVFLAHRSRDREPVVLAYEDLGHLVDRREVEGFVRVAFRSRALPVTGHQDLVGAVHLQRVRDARPANQLRCHRRAAGGDVESSVREVAGRLLATGRRIGGLGQHRQHQIERSDAHAQAQHHVAVVGRDPVVLRLQSPADADLGGLVAGARDDEGRSPLAVQYLEPVVDLAAQEHVVEPGLESFRVQIGVAPLDGILEMPLRAEGRTFGLDGGGHQKLRCGSRGRRRRGPLPSRPR